MNKYSTLFKLLKIDFVFFVTLFIATFPTMISGIDSKIFGRLGLSLLIFLLIIQSISFFLFIILNLIIVQFKNKKYVLNSKIIVEVMFVIFYNVFLFSEKIRPQEVSILHFIPLLLFSIVSLLFYWNRLRKKIPLLFLICNTPTKC